MVYFYQVSMIFPFLAIVLSFLVFIRDPRRITHAVFFLMGITAALFTFFIFLSYLFEGRAELTTVFNRFSVAFTITQVGLNLFFSLIFPTIRIRHLVRSFLLVMLPVLLVASCAVVTDLFVIRMEIQSLDGTLTMIRKPGILYRTLYAPMVAGYILVSCAAFLNQYRKSTTGIEKKHVLYTAVAIGTGGIASTITCIILPGFGLSTYYAVGPVLMAPFYVCLMSYNILSLKAMDIDQFIAKVVLFGFTVFLVISLIGYATYTILSHPEQYTAATATLIMLGSFLFILFYLLAVQPEIDRRIRRKAFELRETIETFNRKIIKLKSLDDLISSIFSIIDRTLCPENLSFFLAGDAPGDFHLHKFRNYTGLDTIRLSQQQLMTIPLMFDEVIEKEQVERNPAYKKYQKAGAHYFSAFDCVLAVPVVFEGTLIGVINIGRKTRGFYSRVEITFLEKLKTGINIALHNSMLLKEIEEINIANARFVPSQFLSFLGRQKLIDVRLGDHVQKQMTIVFSDIKGFTSLSETMTPQENFAFLNSYLSRVSPVIRHMNGFIDKYVGDAIMALFPDSVDDALKASLMMLKELRAFNRNPTRPARAIQVDVGIGLHTGFLMLGTIGEAERMEGTVISDAVNLTSRIERMTRIFGSTLIASEAAFAQVTDPEIYQYRHLGHVRVKGKNQPVGMIDIFDEDPAPVREMKQATRSLFEEGIHYYLARSFHEAERCFQNVVDNGFDDKASMFYLNRIKERPGEIA